MEGMNDTIKVEVKRTHGLRLFRNYAFGYVVKSYFIFWYEIYSVKTENLNRWIHAAFECLSLNIRKRKAIQTNALSI